MKKIQIRKLTMSAMFLALGLILPFFTGQIPQIGSMLLPMHLPVFVCGMVCGGWYGGVIGFIMPILRYMLFGMPPIFPTGLAMSFEMAVYGLVAGHLFQHNRWKCFKALYRSLVIAMISGRIVWGIVFALFCGMSSQTFTWTMFLAAAFIEAIPGIVLQLILVPILVKNVFLHMI